MIKDDRAIPQTVDKLFDHLGDVVPLFWIKIATINLIGAVTIQVLDGGQSKPYDLDGGHCPPYDLN